MSHTEETDKAVTQLLSVDSKLGILAGLTLIAKRQQELQSEDEDVATVAGSPNDRQRELSSRKTQWKRRGSVHVGVSGDGSNFAAGGAAGGSSGTASEAAASPSLATVAATNKKYSVHDQRDAIRRLQEQNQILKQELSIEYRDTKTMLSHEKRQQLAHLQTMAATFARKIETVKRHVARVDELLVKRAQELEVARQQHSESSIGKSSDAAGGSYSSLSSAAAAVASSDGGSSGSTATAVTTVAAAESTAASTRRLRALENRLELSLVKKNEMESINKHLRAQIEKVRKDRVIFDGIYKKLEKEMSECRQRHELSVDELARASDAKQQVHVEIARIQAQAEHEQRAYEQQFQELKAAIETSLREAARLGGGVGIVGAASPLAHGSPFASSKAAGDVDESSPLVSSGVAGAGVAGGATMMSFSAKDSPLNRVSVLSSWKIGYDRALAATNESAIAKYDRAFAGIKRLTGIQDVAQIAAEIVRRDDANFKRFKRVEELHQDEVALHAQIDTLTQQIDAFKAQEGIATSATQKQQCRALTETLEHALAKSRAFDSDFEDTTTTLARLKSSVHSIHSMLAHASCARSSVDPFSQGSAHLALGSHSARDVTDANVLEYLQAIETFTTSLMKETHGAAATTSAMEAHTSQLASSLGDSGERLASTSPSAPLAAPALFGQPASHASVAAIAATQDIAASSPIGHGPPTLPSDPAQKLRVHVPSFGGVNGVIIVPASSPFCDGEPIESSSSSGSKRAQSPIKSLQQQQQQMHLHQGLQRRKSASRFELAARKSLSQMQFVAALAAAAASTSDQPLPVLHHPPPHALSASSGVGTGGLTATGSSGGSKASDGSAPSAGADSQLTRARLEEEEEERALTYDELRQFAAKNVVKRKSDAPAEPLKDHHA